MQTDFDSAIAEYGFNSREQYEQCLADIRDKINKDNDLEWADIINKYQLTINDCTLRKASSTIFGGKFVSDYMKNNVINDASYSWQLNEIRKEKQKLSDERTALRKLSRDASRVEQDLEYLSELVKKNAYQPVLTENIRRNGSKDLIVCLSDIHLGLDVKSCFGEYNSDVAERRMQKYLSDVISIGRLHQCENVYCVILGDVVSGTIHKTVQLQNRENLVEQVQKVSELLSEFVYELSKEFTDVFVNSVAGNHSRVGFKDDVLRGERLDDIPIWYMKAKLGDIANVNFVNDYNYDPTIGRIFVRNKEYWMTHGDLDRFSEAGISKLVMLIGSKPEALIVGHLHHCSYDDVAGVKIIRSGSFSDPVDDYSVSKRICGHASQMVIVCSDEGVETLYPVDLP